MSTRISEPNWQSNAYAFALGALMGSKTVNSWDHAREFANQFVHYVRDETSFVRRGGTWTTLSKTWDTWLGQNHPHMHNLLMESK